MLPVSRAWDLGLASGSTRKLAPRAAAARQAAARRHRSSRRKRAPIGARGRACREAPGSGWGRAEVLCLSAAEVQLHLCGRGSQGKRKPRHSICREPL